MKNRIALNVIVGPGESMELNRLLESFYDINFFDERVIVNTSNDEKIDEVAANFNSKIIHTNWSTEKYPYGNFARARNIAIKNTDSEIILWADADDKAHTANSTGLQKLRPILQDTNLYDFYLVNYHTEVNTKTNAPLSMTWRERIFQNRPDIGWIYACHEQLTVNDEKNTYGQIDGFIMQHFPAKIGVAGLKRNVQIMEHEIKSGRECNHYSFYLARDKYLIGEKNDAVRMLEAFVNRKNVNQQNQLYSFIMLAIHFAYRKIDTHDMRYSIDKSGIEKARKYAEAAISLSENFAEPYVILGDMELEKENYGKAINLYREAMSKKIGSGGSQFTQYYGELPARRLAKIYLEKKQLEPSLFYNRVAMYHSPGDEELINMRKHIIEKLNDEIDPVDTSENIL